MLDKRVSIVMALVAGLVAGIACSDDEEPAGPTAGTLSITLTTPHMDDGAILFEVTGPDIVGFTFGVSGHYRHIRQDGSTLTVIAIGDIESGLLVGFDVADVGAAASYNATVLQVADRANELRSNLTGYDLTVD